MIKFFKGILVISVIFFLFTGVYAVIDKVKTSNLFRISSVEVKGVINANRDELTKISKELIGKNIFDESINNILVSNDVWVQKLTAERVLPNNINLVVFEEKPLFNYKDNGKCYTYVATEKKLKTSCDNVKISIVSTLDKEKAKKFYNIYNNNLSILENAEIILKEYSFVAKINDETIICPYDENLFQENYNIYVNTLKSRYKHIDYVDLTVNQRIFIKGDKNGSTKG